MNDGGMRLQRKKALWKRATASCRRARGYLIVSLSCLLASGAAWAQATPQASGPPAAGADSDPFADVEEMIVVGSENVSSLTTSSTSVTSFDAIKLESMGVGNIADIAAFTPNLEIRTAGSTAATFFIRGVGLNDFTANAASAVAVYVDDAPRNLPAIQLGLLYDTERLDVEKGPQGSGPGRNASAGAIRIYSKKPTGEYDAHLNMNYGNYNLIDIEGALEVPIIEDMLGVRSAFRLLTRDGIVKNRCGGLTAEQIQNSVICGLVRPGIEDDLNNTDTWSARTTLRFLPPVDDMEWNLVVHVDRVDQLATVGQHIGTITTVGGLDNDGYRSPEIQQEATQILRGLPPIPTNRDCGRAPNPAACFELQGRLTSRANDRLATKLANRPLDKLPFEGDYNNPGFERQTSAGGTLSGDWQIGSLVLKNITGYEQYDRERLIDADYSPNTTFEFDIKDRAWQVTEDVRLASELEVLPLSWEVGAFYLQEQLDYIQGTLANRGAVRPIQQAYIQKTRSLGVFADISIDLLDDLTLDAGARYNWEQKSFDAEIFFGTTQDGNDRCLPDLVTGNPPCHRTDTVDHPTGTVAFTYRFDELRELSLKFSHGWKGLQYNARDGTVATEVTDVADPEVIDAFELGFKGGWFDDRLSIDGALFWYAYQNYQVFTFTNNPRTPPVRVVINADNAQNFGAELSTTVRPIEGLTADVRFGWLETKFLDFTNSVSRTIPGGTGTQTFLLVFDYNQNQLPNAPRFKVSGGIEYAFDLNRLGRITPRYDITWTDDVNFDPSAGRGVPDASGNFNRPDYTIGQKGFALQNVSIRYIAPSEQLELAVWARNITNEVYKTLSFDASGGPGFVGNLVGDPRTYGVSVKLLY